jgi:hypothetical protein
MNTIMTDLTVPERTAQTPSTIRKGIKLEAVVAWLGCAVLLVSVVFIVDHPPINERTDFSVTYLGSRMVYLGMGRKLYDLSEQAKLKRALLPDAEPLIFEHPPFEALLLSPLGALPYKTAYLLWGIINVAIWLFLPYILRPYLSMPRDDLAYLLLWLLFLPLGAALFEGQSSLMMLLLYSLTFIQLRSARDLLAGVVFGLALLKFQFAIPFAIILLLQKKWRFLLGFMTTATGLGLLSVMAVGWKGILSYFRLVTSIAAHPENPTFGSARGMATLAGFVNPLFGKILGHTAAFLIVAAISMFLLLWTAWRWRKAGFAADRRTFDLMFAAAVAVSLATSLHMFTHDLSPLLLAMLITADYFPAKNHRSLRVVLGTALALLWTPPLFFVLLARHCFYLFFPVLMLLLLGILQLTSTPKESLASPQMSDPAPRLPDAAYTG